MQCNRNMLSLNKYKTTHCDGFMIGNTWKAKMREHNFCFTPKASLNKSQRRYATST